MIRKYSIAIEGEARSYSAYVPELPTILVTAESIEELSARAAEAIRLYFEELRSDLETPAMLREIEVELPV
jgi:predicted RNase H-like HicB family nuclease